MPLFSWLTSVSAARAAAAKAPQIAMATADFAILALAQREARVAPRGAWHGLCSIWLFPQWSQFVLNLARPRLEGRVGIRAIRFAQPRRPAGGTLCLQMNCSWCCCCAEPPLPPVDYEAERRLREEEEARRLRKAQRRKEARAALMKVRRDVLDSQAHLGAQVEASSSPRRDYPATADSDLLSRSSPGARAPAPAPASPALSLASSSEDLSRGARPGMPGSGPAAPGNGRSAGRRAPAGVAV